MIRSPCIAASKNKRQIRYDGVQFENSLDIFPIYMVVSVMLFELKTKKNETRTQYNLQFAPLKRLRQQCKASSMQSS